MSRKVYTYSSLDDSCFSSCFFRMKKCFREIFMKLSGFKKYKYGLFPNDVNAVRPRWVRLTPSPAH
jgi:hypothetical protein